MTAEIITLVGTGIQAAGVGALTVLLLLMSRTLRRPYLRTWALGWAWLSVALAALQVALRIPGRGQALQVLYHFGELAFLAFMAKGILQACGRSMPSLRLPGLFAGLISLLLPWNTATFTEAFVVQAALLSLGFLLLFALLRGADGVWDRGLGLGVTQASLLLLAFDFGFHALVLSGLLFKENELPPAYAGFTSLYDFLFEMLLAFGLVVLALQDAASRIRTLTRLLPVCAWCRKVRDDQGYWSEFETWVRAQGVEGITHGVCPACKEQVLRDARDGSAPT